MNLYFGAGTDCPVSIATDLQRYLPEDKKHQYRDAYSMAEAAKCWVAAGGFLPRDIEAIIGDRSLTSAHFEYPTRVWGRGMAMTDVMAFTPRTVIAVEAKVNERFDDEVSVWIEREAKRNSRSPEHRRKVIEKYARALAVEPARLMAVRYQLLQRTLCAALTARARDIPEAWMIVQSFASETVEGHRLNRADFDAYLALTGDKPVLEGVKVKLAWVSSKP